MVINQSVFDCVLHEFIDQLQVQSGKIFDPRPVSDVVI